MEKPISRPMHGLADYLYIPLVWAAPKLFGFEDEDQAITLCQVFSGSVLASTLFTRSEWGLIRVMPFKVHLGLDFISGLAALGAPWLFGFARNQRARNTFLAIGVTAISASMLTQPAEMKQQPKRVRGGAVRSLRTLGVL